MQIVLQSICLQIIYLFTIVETTTSSSLADTSSGCKHEEETRGGGKGVKMMMSALWEEGGEDLDQYLV